MMLRIVIPCSLILTLLSCASEKSVIQDNSNRPDYICGGNFDSPEIEIPRGASMFQIGFVLKGSDTLYPSELICLDSVKFTRDLLEDVLVNEMCLEMGIQGTTYFSMRTNKYGGFEDVKVIRSLETCFRDFEKRIVSKVSKMRILQEEYFSSEIVFRHKYMIR